HVDAGATGQEPRTGGLDERRRSNERSVGRKEDVTVREVKSLGELDPRRQVRIDIGRSAGYLRRPPFIAAADDAEDARAGAGKVKTDRDFFVGILVVAGDRRNGKSHQQQRHSTNEVLHIVLLKVEPRSIS